MVAAFWGCQDHNSLLFVRSNNVSIQPHFYGFKQIYDGEYDTSYLILYTDMNAQTKMSKNENNSNNTPFGLQSYQTVNDAH